FGIAAFVVAALALVGTVPIVQLIAFVALSVGLLGLVRPRTLHLLGRQVPRGMLTNPGVRPDREALVVEDVSSSAGMVRLGNAECWTARAYQPGVVLPKGTRVRVVYVDGLTAFVEAVPAPPLPAEAVPAPETGATVDEPAPDGARH